MADLNIENIKLKEQLAEEEKKRISLELKIRKLIQTGHGDNVQDLKH